MKNINNITDKEIVDFAYGKDDFRNNPIRKQQIAQYICSNSDTIAEIMQIPDDEAYKMYIKRVKVRFEESEKKKFHESIKNTVFAASEVTPELMDALAKNGIRSINVIPDDEYESYIFEQYLKNLK